MINYAVITDGKVTNVIVLEPANEASFAEATGWTLVELGDMDSPDYQGVQIGWSYDAVTKTFSAE